MPAPSASTPFFPNLNQQVVLEPLEHGPILVGLHHPSRALLLAEVEPTNGEVSLQRVVAEGDELTGLDGVKVCWRIQGIEAIVALVPGTKARIQQPYHNRWITPI